jgi:phage terminase large subunit-like protein
MAARKTPAKVSASESQDWKNRPGNPGGARSEAQKQGLAASDPVLTYAWDDPKLSRVERVVVFLESLPITKGILLGQPMRLLPTQREFVELVYGEGSIAKIGVQSEPRGNGKTGLVAGLALCHLLGPEAEERGEIDSASIDRDMAALIFAEMVAICLAVSSFAARVNIQRVPKRIEVLWGPGKGSVYGALSADVRRGHGLAPSLWIYDELAQAKDGELLSNLRTAMGKRARSLGLVISTQAPEDDHPLSQLIDDGLSGADPSIVVQLIAADAEADIYDPAVIRSVNPAMGIFLDESVVMAEASQAKRRPIWEPKFRNLRLNQRVDAETDSRLAQAVDWKAAQREIDPEALLGRRCIGALDLSGKFDYTALVLAFPDDQPEVGYDLLAFFWTPEGQLRARPSGETERLLQWIDAGHMEVVPGPTIRYAVVAKKILEVTQRYEMQTLAYDRWRIEDLKQDLAELGLDDLPLEPFGQGHSKVMAPAIEYFSECLVTGRLRHPGNPALTSSILNAVVVLDRGGNPMLDKSRTRRGVGRIDGAVSTVMALGTARRAVGEHVEGSLIAV